MSVRMGRRAVVIGSNATASTGAAIANSTGSSTQQPYTRYHTLAPKAAPTTITPSNQLKTSEKKYDLSKDASQTASGHTSKTT